MCVLGEKGDGGRYTNSHYSILHNLRPRFRCSIKTYIACTFTLSIFWLDCRCRIGSTYLDVKMPWNLYCVTASHGSQLLLAISQTGIRHDHQPRYVRGTLRQDRPIIDPLKPSWIMHHFAFTAPSAHNSANISIPGDEPAIIAQSYQIICPNVDVFLKTFLVGVPSSVKYKLHMIQIDRKVMRL